MATPAQAAARNAKLLRDRAQRMRNLQRPALATARQIGEMIDRAYASKREPYGRGWRPLKYRDEPPPALQLTGRSKRSVKVTATKGEIRFYALDYLYAHMAGVRSRKLPKRNPTPFELRNGRWMVKPQVMRLHQRRIQRWIESGVVV